MKTRKAKLEEIRPNTDGTDVIYETPGDEQRGNPLDIVTLAECHDSEDVTGLTFDAREIAERIVRCWNTHERLIACVESFIQMCDATPGMLLIADEARMLLADARPVVRK